MATKAIASADTNNKKYQRRVVNPDEIFYVSHQLKEDFSIVFSKVPFEGEFVDIKIRPGNRRDAKEAVKAMANGEDAAVLQGSLLIVEFGEKKELSKKELSQPKYKNILLAIDDAVHKYTRKHRLIRRGTTPLAKDFPNQFDIEFDYFDDSSILLYRVPVGLLSEPNKEYIDVDIRPLTARHRQEAEKMEQQKDPHADDKFLAMMIQGFGDRDGVTSIELQEPKYDLLSEIVNDALQTYALKKRIKLV